MSGRFFTLIIIVLILEMNLDWFIQRIDQMSVSITNTTASIQHDVQQYTDNQNYQKVVEESHVKWYATQKFIINRLDEGIRSQCEQIESYPEINMSGRTKEHLYSVRYRNQIVVRFRNAIMRYSHGSQNQGAINNLPVLIKHCSYVYI